MNSRRRRWIRSLAPLMLVSLVTLYWGLRIESDRPTAASAHARDLYSSYLPNIQWTIAELRAGRLPLWDPYQFAGMPAFATLEHGPLYPLTYIYAFGNLYDAHIRSALIHLVLMALSMYIFVRRVFALSETSALVAGLCFALSGWAGSRGLVYPDAFRSAVFIPLMFLLVDQTIRKPGARNVVTLATLATLQFFAGELEIVVRTSMFLLPFAAIRIHASRRDLRTKRTAGRIMVALGSSALLAIGLAAVQLFPTYELSRESLRSTSGMTYGQVVDPYDGGVASAAELFDAMVAHSADPNLYFIGIFPILLAAYALRRPRPDPVFFGIAAVLTFMLILGEATPLYRLYYHLPTGDWFRFPLRFQVFLTFFVSILAAFGMERLHKDIDPDEGRPDNRKMPLAIFAGAALLVFVWDRIESSVESSISLGLLLILIAALATGFRPRLHRISRFASTAVLLAGVAVFPLFTFDLTPYNTPEGFDITGTPRPILDELAVAAEPGDRIYTDFSTLEARRVPKFGVLSRIESIDGFSPFMPRTFWTTIKPYRAQRFKDAAAGIESQSQDASLGLWGGLAASSGALDALDMFGVRYLLLGPGSELYPPLPGTLRPQAPEHYRVLKQDGDMILLENPNPWPRAFVIPDKVDSVAALREAVEQDMHPVQIVEKAPSAVLIDVQNAPAGYLVLTDQHYPGWRAYADNVPIRIDAIAGMFRGVRLPPGTREVHFRYRPMSVYLGFAMSSIALLGSIVAVALSSMKKARNESTPSA